MKLPRLWLGRFEPIKRPVFPESESLEQKLRTVPVALRSQLSDAVRRGDRELAKRLTAEVVEMMR